MARPAAALAACAVAAFAATAWAGPRAEVEPNNLWPPVAPVGGALIQPGDQITGAITPGDSDLILLQVPGFTPSASNPMPGWVRHRFELATTGDATLDLIEPETGRILASSDDATNAAATLGHPGACRIIFDQYNPTGSASSWVALIRGFWPDQELTYTLTHQRLAPPAPTPVTVSEFITVPVMSSLDVTSSAAGPTWFSVDLPREGAVTAMSRTLVPVMADTAIVAFDGAGQYLGTADDNFGGIMDFWSSDGMRTGTVLLAVGAAPARVTWEPIVGSGQWFRRGVGAGDQRIGRREGATFPPTLVPGATILLDVGFYPPQDLCGADFDQDGGITGADIEAFFLAFEAGDPRGDFDQDGGITGADIEAFFLAFEAGC